MRNSRAFRGLTVLWLMCTTLLTVHVMAQENDHPSTAQEVSFLSTNGLTVYAHLYEVDEGKPIILLCHQARYNKYEYAEIAPELNELGYNCMAIDQRSGGDLAGHRNPTADAAEEKGLGTSYVDAVPDMKAAIAFLHNKYGRPIICWGSSYSSSLTLLETYDDERVMAMIAFSPGDYFGNSKPSLSTVFGHTEKPFFVTSSREESAGLSKLVGEGILNENQVQFIPESSGFHGSKALWPGQKGGGEYWQALTRFLGSL